jgi:hypothetical protein
VYLNKKAMKMGNQMTTEQMCIISLSVYIYTRAAGWPYPIQVLYNLLGWTELRDERIELRAIARGVCLRGWLIHQLAWRNPEFLIDRYVFCFVFLYRTNNRGHVVHGTQMTRIAAKWEPVVYRVFRAGGRQILEPK